MRVSSSGIPAHRERMSVKDDEKDQRDSPPLRRICTAKEKGISMPPRDVPPRMSEMTISTYSFRATTASTGFAPFATASASASYSAQICQR